MSSTTAVTARCTACREARDPADLLLVHVDGRPAYSVCRPSFRPPALSVYRSAQCFRDVGPASRERIELLSDYLARQPEARR